MAAFALIELSEKGAYHSTEYEQGDVLRVPSDVAMRLIKREKAKPYKGQKKPKNLEETEPKDPEKVEAK